VALSTRLALASPHVTTDVIMVPLFPYLAVRHGVADVPTTVVNGRACAVGPMEESAYLGAVLGVASQAM
jgi:hypothetical protein